MLLSLARGKERRVEVRMIKTAHPGNIREGTSSAPEKMDITSPEMVRKWSSFVEVVCLVLPSVSWMSYVSLIP
jgi:hypothetical protein